MKHVGLKIAVLVCAVLCVHAVQVFAQEATIVGTVTDPSGAAIPGATVTITNTGTGQARTVTTNTVGQYVAPDLIIGRYVARVDATGFKAVEHKDIALAVGDRLRIDFKLELGTPQDVVTVEASPIAVQSESGEISDLITGQQVSQLSTNGRSIYSLATLTAGASSNMPDFQSATPVGGNATVSFNGLRQSHNLYMVDGGEDYDRGGSGNISIMPSVDSIAEFRALTSNYSAEYGLSSGGTMTMVFKSGSKDFHGSAWEFLRNDALDANDFFFNAAHKQPPELRFNTFGFNVSGPVTIPGVYNDTREKTFFFYNMEWRRLVQGGNVNQTVPLPSEYTGAFPSSVSLHVPNASQLAPSQLARFTAAGLTPGGPFTNNTIPGSLLDPNAQLLLKTGIFPAPTSGAQFVGGNKLPTDVREEIVRIDHHFNSKLTVFGHWVSEAINQTYGTSMWSGDNVPTASNTFDNPSYSGVIRATHTISPTILNEVSFNYNGNRINIVPSGIVSRPTGLNIPELFKSNTSDRIPGIALGGATGTNYTTASWPWHNKADDYQIRDDFSWTKGSHQLKFGASWAIYKKIQDLFGTTQGGFSFNGSYTGNDFADFLLGFSNSYNELAVQDHGFWDNTSWALYALDDWKVSSRLTLNLGLRWDTIPHTYEENNRQSNFYPNLYDPSKRAIILPNGSISPNSPGLGTSPNPDLNGIQFYLNGIGIAGQNGIPPGLVQNFWGSFGPRLGFAYDPTGKGKTVFRGGFGIMYERIQGNDVYNAGPNVPFSSSVTFNNVSLSNPNVSLLTGQTLAAPITVSDITGLAYTDYKAPASYQYSVGIQRELMPGSVLSLSYVGNTNRHQNDYRETNLPDQSLIPSLINGTVAYNTVVPYLGFHSIRLSENAGTSHYNSLQVNYHGEFKNRLSMQAVYTLSKAEDFSSGDLSNVSNPYDRAYDIGPSPLDRRHIGLVNFIYKVPFFSGSNVSRLVRTSLGGWEVSGIVTMESGLPLGINLGGAQGSNGIANATNRPDWSGSVAIPGTVNAYFDKSAFSLPTLGAWGNYPRGSVYGPGRDDWNISLFKSFIINESRGSRVEFRFETFNFWNHTQFNNVSTSYSASNFGAVTSVWDPRTLQLGLKLIF